MNISCSVSLERCLPPLHDTLRAAAAVLSLTSCPTAECVRSRGATIGLIANETGRKGTGDTGEDSALLVRTLLYSAGLSSTGEDADSVLLGRTLLCWKDSPLLGRTLLYW